MLTLPFRSLGIGLGQRVFLPFQLYGVVLVLKALQSGKLLFRGHVRITFNEICVDFAIIIPPAFGEAVPSAVISVFRVVSRLRF